MDRTFVVTGDAGYSPSIQIWQASNGEYVTQILLPVATCGVSTCSISACRRYVAIVDKSPDQRVWIFHLNTQKSLLAKNATIEPILDIAWSKRANDLRFATVTNEQVTFFHPANITKKLM